ncbi:MAG TPA: diphthine--ammonia ligase [Thermodesulfovibrionales bacterium]|nr:diphthine--ammonia ligase [Thermodesulfovibrionales bacterium]
MKEKIIFTWSGGKDSAMALHELKRNAGYEIVALLTTITEDYDRISMHGVRRELLEAQAVSLGIRLEKVLISTQSSNEDYESRMRAALEQYKAKGVSSVAFGDIFLEELRRYREDNLAKIGMKGIFPLWKRRTSDLARDFIHAGFRAVITCVDSEALDKRFAGREFDKAFLSELPSGIDPCGENGEFHSFVYDGPVFKNWLRHTRGEMVLRDQRFWYLDLVPPEIGNK